MKFKVQTQTKLNTWILTYLFPVVGWNSSLLAKSWFTDQPVVKSTILIPACLMPYWYSPVNVFHSSVYLHSQCLQTWAISVCMGVCSVWVSVFCSFHICKRSRLGQISLWSKLALSEQYLIMQSNYFTTRVHLVFQRKINHNINNFYIILIINIKQRKTFEYSNYLNNCTIK